MLLGFRTKLKLNNQQKTLSECGLEIDRDLNAAKVLASQAVGYTVLACGQSAADGSGGSRK